MPLSVEPRSNAPSLIPEEQDVLVQEKPKQKLQTKMAKEQQPEEEDEEEDEEEEDADDDYDRNKSWMSDIILAQVTLHAQHAAEQSTLAMKSNLSKIHQPKPKRKRPDTGN